MLETFDLIFWAITAEATLEIKLKHDNNAGYSFQALFVAFEIGYISRLLHCILKQTKLHHLASYKDLHYQSNIYMLKWGKYLIAKMCSFKSYNVKATEEQTGPELSHFVPCSKYVGYYAKCKWVVTQKLGMSVGVYMCTQNMVQVCTEVSACVLTTPRGGNQLTLMSLLTLEVEQVSVSLWPWVRNTLLRSWREIWGGASGTDSQSVQSKLTEQIF